MTGEDLLLNQYKLMTEDIRQIEASNEKIFGLGVTIVSAAILYGRKENIQEVYFVAPVALLGVLLFVSHQYHHLFWRGGHKRAIEDYLNSVVGRPALVWEHLVHTQRKRLNFGNSMFGLFLLISFAGLTAFCVAKIYEIFGGFHCYLFAAVVVWLTLALLLNVVEAKRAFEISYGETHRLLQLDQSAN